MTLVSSSEWLFFIGLVGLIWSFNQYVIIHVIMRRSRRRLRNGDNTDNDPPTVVLLHQTYDIIYRPVTTTFLESNELRTWLWLVLALLLNIVCISIELTLFEELTYYDHDGGSGEAGGSNSNAYGKSIHQVTVGDDNKNYDDDYYNDDDDHYYYDKENDNLVGG